MNRKKGFTLIELLVVIAIIAILAAILYPVFKKVRDRAFDAQCISNLNQIGKAILLYKDDYDGYYPPFALLDYTIAGSPAAFVSPYRMFLGRPVWPMPYLLDPYLKGGPDMWDHEPKGDMLSGMGIYNYDAGSYNYGGVNPNLAMGVIGIGAGTIELPMDYACNPVVHLRNCSNIDTDKWDAWSDWFWPATQASGGGGGDGSFRGWAPTLHESQVNWPSMQQSLGDARTITFGCNSNEWTNCQYGFDMTSPNRRHMGHANVLACDGHIWQATRAFNNDCRRANPAAGISGRTANNSPFPDGGYWSRKGNTDPLDDTYWINNPPAGKDIILDTQLHTQGSPNTPLAIWAWDDTDGEAYTTGRPLYTTW